MDWLHRIQKCFEVNSVFYTKHARLEMKAEPFGRIFEHEVWEAICQGQIIEEYADDKPYPSVLVFGKTNDGRPLHVVSAYNEEENITIVITVYHPDPDLWIEHGRRMK